jgi:hypothetical protein
MALATAAAEPAGYSVCQIATAGDPVAWWCNTYRHIHADVVIHLETDCDIV